MYAATATTFLMKKSILLLLVTWRCKAPCCERVLESSPQLRHRPTARVLAPVVEWSRCPTQLALRRWPNVGPTSTLTLGQRRLTNVGPTWICQLAQRWPNGCTPTLAQRRHTNVGPTLCQWLYANVVPTLAQRRLRYWLFVRGTHRSPVEQTVELSNQWFETPMWSTSM